MDSAIQTNDTPNILIFSFTIDFDMGDDFALALIDSGEIIAWGDNSYGQLDVPAEIYRPTPIQLAEMGITGNTQSTAPDAAELSMLGAGGLGIQWGESNTPYEVQTTTDILGGEWESLPTDANNRFYRINPAPSN